MSPLEWFCNKMGDGESQVIVKESRSIIEPKSLCLPALPLGQTGPLLCDKAHAYYYQKPDICLCCLSRIEASTTSNGKALTASAVDRPCLGLFCKLKRSCAFIRLRVCVCRYKRALCSNKSLQLHRSNWSLATFLLTDDRAFASQALTQTASPGLRHPCGKRCSECGTYVHASCQTSLWTVHAPLNIPPSTGHSSPLKR